MRILPRIIPSAEPFFLKGNDTACILLHGFTGTPKEMRWLGEFLNQRSFTVIAPRLCGHATNPVDMQRNKYEDWISSVEDAYHFIRPHVNKIYVIGLSMGGVLAGITATYLKYNGLVTISTPFEFPHKDWRLPFVRLLAFLQPRIKKGKQSWLNPDASTDHIDYPYYPTKSIAELADLIQLFQKKLLSISIPSLHIHSTKDQSVPYNHLDQIFEMNGASIKQKFTVENSDHVIIREPDRFTVFEKIFDFISQNY